MHRFPALSLAAVAFGLFTATLQFPAQAASDVAEAEYQRWTQALDSLASAGHQRIEEIELTLLGRFKVEVLDDQRLERELRLSRDGHTLLKSRSKDSMDDGADAVTLEQLRAGLVWLQREGYRDLEKLSGDEGLLEAEVRNAEGRKVELKLDAAAQRMVAIEPD